MAYPGVAFAVILGVGLATAAVMYFLSQREPVHAYQNKDYYGPPQDTSYKDWDSESVRRRRKKSDVQQKCSICLDTMNDNIKTLPCRHKFHKKCIDQWLRESMNENQSCALCRKRATL